MQESATQETLCYQLAGLLQRVYGRVSRSLGADFDSSAATQEMRVSNWISPVYARLQRRFVRFASASVEEKVEEIFSNAFDQLIDKLSMEISPRYLLSGPLDSAVYETSSNDSSSDGNVEASDDSLSSSSNIAPYPPMDVAALIIKILRNSVSCCMDINSLESRALRGMRSYIASEMKPLGKPLEQVYNSRRAFLSEKESRLVEQMLNLGHSSLAAVFVQWQIRYTLVGTPEATEPGMPKKFLKDFLRPVQLGSPKLVLNGIPKELRDECGFKVDEVADRLKPTDRLRAAALLSHAVRESAAQEFRALIAYDSSLDDMPTSRDAVYIGL